MNRAETFARALHAETDGCEWPPCIARHRDQADNILAALDAAGYLLVAKDRLAIQSDQADAEIVNLMHECGRLRLEVNRLRDALSEFGDWRHHDHELSDALKS